MTPARPLLLLGCFIGSLATNPACATGGYAGPQIVVSSKGEVSLEVLVSAGIGETFTNTTTRNRSYAIRSNLEAFIGYQFNVGKLVGGFGNVLNISSRPAFATSGHDFRVGSRFRFGGGRRFQGGFTLQYAHVRVLEATREFPTCPARGIEYQSWTGPAIAAEMLLSKRGNNRGAAINANVVVGTVLGRDRFSQGRFPLRSCGEPSE